MTATDPLLLAYLAGVLDSDGSITIFRHKTNNKYPDSFTFSELVSVGQTSPEAVTLFADLWPGPRVMRKRHQNWKPIYEWRITDRSAALCVATLRPYLRVKARQADLVLALRQSKGRPWQEIRTERVGLRGTRVGAAIIAERTDWWRQIRALNDTRPRVE